MARRPLRRWIFAALLLAACEAAPPDDALVVLTPFDGAVVAAMEEAFGAAHPGVALHLETVPDSVVLERLEAGHVGAHVWWGADWHALAEAAEMDALRPVAPSWASTTGGASQTTDAATAPASPPASDAVRDPDGRWLGLYASPVVLVFHGERVTRSRAPRDWLDLFHFRWRDELVLPPADGAVMRAVAEQAMLEELRRTGLESAGRDFLFRLDATAAGYAPDEREQLRRLQAGEASLTLLPAHRAVARADETPDLAARMMESGTARLLRGVARFRRAGGGVTPPGGAEDRDRPASTPLDAAAHAFLEFVGSADAHRIVVEHLGWGPAHPVDGVDRDGAWPAVGRGFPVWGFAADTLAVRADEWYGVWLADVRGRGRTRF